MTLAAQDLCVRYRRVEALRSVCAIARRGCVTAVLGPNGAGKTTLLRALIGAQRPSAGVVLLDDEPIRSVARRHRAARLAYVAQRPLMATAMTVRETVELGRYALPPRPERIAAALAEHDLDALADRRVTTLSAGQQQRVALARAFAQVEPDGMVVLDEPAAALDFAHARALATRVRAFAATGGGVVVSVHDLALAAAIADVVWILAAGRLAIDAPASEALSPSTLEPIFGVPFHAVSSGHDGEPVVLPQIAPQRRRA